MDKTQDSIFTKIIKGEIPCHKVYEDERTLAFLDISPSQPGHTLVIPKVQVEFVWDLDDEDYQAVMATAKKVARRLRDVLEVPYVGVRVIGTDVPHAHVHLVPFTTADDYYARRDMDTEPDHPALAALAQKLKFE
jgi:histidine triad (HIT) family protein